MARDHTPGLGPMSETKRGVEDARLDDRTGRASGNTRRTGATIPAHGLGAVEERICDDRAEKQPRPETRIEHHGTLATPPHTGPDCSRSIDQPIIINDRHCPPVLREQVLFNRGKGPTEAAVLVLCGKPGDPTCRRGSRPRITRRGHVGPGDNDDGLRPWEAATHIGRSGRILVREAQLSCEPGFFSALQSVGYTGKLGCGGHAESGAARSDGNLCELLGTDHFRSDYSIWRPLRSGIALPIHSPPMLPLPTYRFGRRFAQLIPGLGCFGIGVALMVRADLGLSPWQVFHQGVAEKAGIAIGTATILTGIVVLLAWIPLRERFGLGTILNVAIIGNMMNLSLLALPDDLGRLAVRLAAMAGGIVLIGLGSGLYIGAGMGPGPRDGLMTGLARRGLHIGAVRTGLEVTVLVVGWMLGGTIGLGTLAFAVTIGPLIAFFLPRLTVVEV